jgi:anti-sigma B factor antagonist
VSAPKVVAPPEAPAVSSGLGWSVRRDDSGAIWVQVAGELDLATSPALERTLDEALRDADSVVLDLRGLEFMDCAGLRVVVEVAERARRQARVLRVARGQPQVDLVFRLTQTTGVVEVFDPRPRLVGDPPAS